MVGSIPALILPEKAIIPYFRCVTVIIVIISYFLCNLGIR